MVVVVMRRPRMRVRRQMFVVVLVIGFMPGMRREGFDSVGEGGGLALSVSTRRKVVPVVDRSIRWRRAVSSVTGGSFIRYPVARSVNDPGRV